MKCEFGHEVGMVGGRCISCGAPARRIRNSPRVDKRIRNYIKKATDPIKNELGAHGIALRSIEDRRMDKELEDLLNG